MAAGIVASVDPARLARPDRQPDLARTPDHRHRRRRSRRRHRQRRVPRDLTDIPTWRGLQVVDTAAGGPDDDTGIVEFRATYLVPGGGVGVQRERSRFVREGSRWYYLGTV